MCCPGCLSAAQAIVNAGLETFYLNRDGYSESPETLPPIVDENLDYYDSAVFKDKYVNSEIGQNQTTLMILGINCAACAWLIEKSLRQLEGVTANINTSNHRLHLQWQPELIKLSEIIQQVLNLGFCVAPFTPDNYEELVKQENRQSLKRLGVAGLGTMQVMMFSVGLYAGSLQGIMGEYKLFLRYVSLLVSSFVVLYSAWPFFYSAFRAIRKIHFNMDLPVSLAIGLAFSASLLNTLTDQGEVYFDSVCMFTFFLLLTRYIEFSIRKKSYQNALSYHYSIPQRYALLDEQLKVHATVDAERLQLGDLILVKPGQSIPVDAEVVSGESTVDEALISGEPLPLLKQKGDLVRGGSENIDDPLSLKVVRAVKDSTLFNIMRLIDRAQSEKPSEVRLADRIASYFVFSILIISSLVAIVWWNLDPERAFPVTLSVLVISCPCALSLATPSALAAAVSALAKNGFLVTRGHTLEALSQVDHVVFDKTGTLTTGKLNLKNTHLYSASKNPQVLNIAAMLEQHSAHPIAKVFSEFNNAYPEEGDLEEIRNFPGRGIEGRISGKLYRIGNLDFVLDKTFFNSSFSSKEVIETANENVFLASDNQLLAGFELVDSLRSDAFETVRFLKQRGIQTHLLSGDPHSSVFEIGEKLGMDKVVNNAMPEEKVAYIKALQSQNAVVAMVGDGINDAPSLKIAQVSIAMGAVGEGADLAKTSSDAIIMNRKLSNMITALDHALSSKAIIRQNYFWAIIYNLSVIPLAAAGYVAPYWSAIGMSLSSLFVVLNSLRLIKFKSSESASGKSYSEKEVLA